MDNSWIPITLEELLALTLEGTKILVTSEGSQVYYKQEKELIIPLGRWSLEGAWTPNLLLDMTQEEQRAHNIKGGYLK